MDFFDREARAQKQTRKLIWLLGLAILAVLVVNNLLLGSLICLFEPSLHWSVVAMVSLGTLISIAGGCYYKIRQLSEGGTVVAEFLGVRRLVASPGDLGEQQLRNVVSEMAVASGLPVPEIYVLDNERGINAFSAGYTHNDIAIGVTRGGVKLLARDELQGVIAHEFSHILNGDTRFNMQLIGLAHGLFWPTLLGRLLMRGTTENL